MYFHEIYVKIKLNNRSLCLIQKANTPKKLLNNHLFPLQSEFGGAPNLEGAPNLGDMCDSPIMRMKLRGALA